MENKTAKILMESIKSFPNVAIVVLNWNGFEHTRNCLNSLRKMNTNSFEVILVDNASTDGSVEKLKKEFKDPIYLINKDNLGFTGGNNIGIEHALKQGFEYIMLLNNDTEVEPDFLNSLLGVISKNPKIGAVQPLMFFLNDKRKVWNAGGKFKKWTGSSNAIKKNLGTSIPYSTDWITGCCILLKSKVIQKVGLLNDKYFAYFEDVDWSLRIRRAGYDLAVVPSSIIYHEAGTSSKSKRKGKEGRLSPKVHFLNTRNQIFQLRNHSGFPFFLFAWPFQFMKLGMYGVYFLLRGRKQKFLALKKGIRAGIIEECI